MVPSLPRSILRWRGRGIWPGCRILSGSSIWFRSRRRSSWVQDWESSGVWRSTDVHLCEQCQSDVTRWCRYYRHQRSVFLSNPLFQWGWGSSPCSRWGRNPRSCSLGPCRRCGTEWWHSRLFLNMSPLEALRVNHLRVIYDLLESESLNLTCLSSFQPFLREQLHDSRISSATSLHRDISSGNFLYMDHGTNE